MHPRAVRMEANRVTHGDPLLGEAVEIVGHRVQCFVEENVKAAKKWAFLVNFFDFPNVRYSKFAHYSCAAASSTRRKNPGLGSTRRKIPTN